ncbi:Response regulator receiver domain protein [compost metagenome]
MHRPYVVIHQARPSHQLFLHQACNALGFFDVRVTHDLGDLSACLVRQGPIDLLILDHALATSTGLALLEKIQRRRASRALLFVGSAADAGPDLAREARRRGLWVLAELAWPLSMPALQQALHGLGGLSARHAERRIQTVMSPTHAH